MNDLAEQALGRRLTMTLLSGPACIFSHCVRIVLLEKDVECGIEFVGSNIDPERVGEHNPYSETPTLVDRDLSLYDPNVIIEYLDERFPHPPLMPVDPITRAKSRLMISRLTRDWMTPIWQLGDLEFNKPSDTLSRDVRDGLLSLSPLVADQPFFLGMDYTLVDAYLAPLLWRLQALDIDLPHQAAPLVSYGERLFERPAFRSSLSPAEMDLRA